MKLIRAHLPRQQSVVVFIVLLCLWSAVSGAPVTGQAQGARHTGRLLQLINRTLLQFPEGEKLLTIIIESNEASGKIRNIVSAGGAQLRYQSGRRYEIEVRTDRARELLARLPSETIARLSWPHEAVATTSQGVALTGAGDMHLPGHDGTGVKIGVIDLGFSSLASAIASGDLPNGQTVTDYTGSGPSGTNHGTNVAEIVHDMAPGAQLFLAKINTDVQLELAVGDMIASGVQVINHSVAWFGAAFYDGTGQLCDITDSAETAGILWANAAGNSRNSHYLDTFSDTDNDLRHEFTAGQNYNTISLNSGSAVTLVLNWDAYPSTTTNYDLFLYNGNPDTGGTLVASSKNNQGGKGPSGFPIPYESIDYDPLLTGTHYIVIRKEKSATPHLPLTLFSLGKALGTKTRASSLTQPADCASVLAVGATNLADNPEGFSSEGPTTDGRNKPEISAPDRVQTSLNGNFAGTSSSSPHAAGAAALVLDANPGYTTAQVRNELTATAQDVSTAGFDFRTGYGRISLDVDGDGVNHDSDNCLFVANTTQTDTDGDGEGNACDSDDDGDGLTDTFEDGIGTNPLLADSDGDGLSDYEEVAWDGDAGDYNPYHPVTNLAGTDLNATAADTDGDGLTDGLDPTPLGSPTPNGDLAPIEKPDGAVNAADYLIALRHVLGEQTLTPAEFAPADLYPPGSPDGVLGMSDLVLLLGVVMQQ